MRKQPTLPPAAESSDIAKLAEVVQGLTHQVQHLAMILDEVREDLVWAVRNDKFHCAGHSQQYVATYTTPTVPDPAEQQAEVVDQPPAEATKPTGPSKQTLFD